MALVLQILNLKYLMFQYCLAPRSNIFFRFQLQVSHFVLAIKLATNPSLPMVSFIFCIYQAIEKLKSFREKLKGKQQYLAMYSSIFGGITTDPAAMVIPMDDHMVHRGHGVFDTTAIMDGLVISSS